MKLCVIMPARDEERFIAAAIASVLQVPPGVDLTVLVIDDGSQDATGRIVADLASQDPRIRLLQSAGEGVSAARNVGLAALPEDTDLVGFLDADDMVVPDRFRQDLALFAAQPDLQVVYGRMCMVETDIEDIPTALTGTEADVLGVSMSAGLYAAAFLRSIGGFDTTFIQSEDFDFLLRIFERKPATAIVDRRMVYYRQHAGNTTKRRAEMRRFFLRAMSEHAKRRRADPSLHAVDWIWGRDAMSSFVERQG